VIKID
jgi:alpha-tubulin suppressor-like RCC1 family protein